MPSPEQVKMLSALQELDRRGALPDEYQPVVEEMRNRGLIPPRAEVSVSGPLEAAMVGGGRAVERFGRGASDIAASLRYDPAGRADIAEQEAESARLYEPVRRQYPMSAAAGESLPYFAVPMGAAGRLAGRAVGTVPGLAGVGAMVGRSPIADAAITGGLLGGLDTESSALGGAVGGALGGAAGGLLGRAIRPVASQPAAGVQSAVSKAGRLGMGVTPAQATGSRSLGLLEASLRSSPFSAGSFERLAGANQARANQIAAEAIGESGKAVTGEVLDRAARRIGDVFEGVADVPRIPLGDEFVSSLARVEQSYNDAVVEPHIRAAVKKAIEGALNAATGGGTTGRAALNASSQHGKSARSLFKGARADPESAKAFDMIKDAWDDAITSGVSSRRSADLMDARRQWKNLLTLERPGVIRAPEVGDVSIASLGNALRQRDRIGFLRQRSSDPLYDLGQVGKALPAAVGDSGTATRMALPLAGAAGLGLSMDDLAAGEYGQGALQFAAPALALMAAGRGYTSPLAGRYLTRGLMPIGDPGRSLLRGAGARLGAGAGVGLLGQD